MRMVDDTQSLCLEIKYLDDSGTVRKNAYIEVKMNRGAKIRVGETVVHDIPREKLAVIRSFSIEKPAQRTPRQTQREAALFLWKEDQTDSNTDENVWMWRSAVIMQTTGRSLNIQQIISMLGIKSYQGLKMLSTEHKDSANSSWEYQMSACYISLFKSSVVVMLERVTTFKEATKALVQLMERSNPIESMADDSGSVTFLINGSKYNCRLCAPHTAEGILEDLESLKVSEKKKSQPLPPVPSYPSTMNGLVSRCCVAGPPPLLDTAPFFLEDLNRLVPPVNIPHQKARRQPSIIMNPEYVHQVKMMKQKNSKFQEIVNKKLKCVGSKPSPRLSTFISSVAQGDYTPLMRMPSMDDDAEYSDRIVYEIPPLRNNPDRVTDGLEQTLYKIMQRFQSTRCAFLEQCPLGMEINERKKFCLRLEFIDTDVIMGGWRDFAEKLMECDFEELTLIEEFSARFGMPPVEVLLEHWSNLEGSPKLHKEPSKRNIIAALHEMKNISLLQEMNWNLDNADSSNGNITP